MSTIEPGTSGYNNETSPNNGADMIAFSNKTIPLLIIGGVAIGSMLIHLLITFILRQIAKGTGWTFDREVVKHCCVPTFFVFPIISILSTLSLIPNVHPTIMEPIRHAFAILLIIFTAWSAIGFVRAASITILKNNELVKFPNNLQSRKLRTQLTISTRIIYGLICWIGIAAIILTFPKAWEIGASILASASVAALLIGFAAKPSIENLINSLQIALTQPLLLNDYIVVDDYQGYVEEIQAQFIVIRTSDERRIIIPLSRVIDGTFENWTRKDENIETYFDFFVDYGIPLKDLRQYYMNNVLQKSNFWDHRDGSLTINECRENCMMLRANMTASNVRNIYKLKDEVCEKLMEYIITTHPEYLPRSRYQQLEKRNGIDSMNKIVTKMEDTNLENNIYDFNEKDIQEKEY